MGLDWNKLQPPKLFNETFFEETYGTEATFIVTDTREEKVGKDEELKGVMRLAETPLGFVLNITNRKALQEKLGKDSDTWRGARVTITLRREGLRITHAVPASQVVITGRDGADTVPF
jgi:hypothetical protein